MEIFNKIFTEIKNNLYLKIFEDKLVTSESKIREEYININPTPPSKTTTQPKQISIFLI